jgi:OFA family oxalate/formate antiporter-like MFS transporter
MSEANSVAAKYGAASAPATQGSFFRWGQLIMGVICMALIANLQYGWTLFVNPLEAKNHWGLTSIQLAFSIFILVETWLVPIEGWLVDKFGPRPVIAGGAVLAAVGWIMNSYATSLTELYAAAVIAGVGAGCVYGTCVGNALKWFPDKRGLAAGFTAAGFGAGAAVTVIPIANMIKTSGYQETFFFFGILQGVLIFIVAMFMIKPSPPKGIVAAPRIVTTKKDYTAAQMMRTPDGDGAAWPDRQRLWSGQSPHDHAGHDPAASDHDADHRQSGQRFHPAAVRLYLRQDRTREYDDDRIRRRRPVLAGHDEVRP